MKRIGLKWLLFALIVLTVTLCAVVTASAVPAKPGSAFAGQQTCPSHTGETVKLSDIPLRGVVKRAPGKSEPRREIPLVVIVVGLKNEPYRDDYDWASTIFTGDKSLTAYYDDMSFGKFTFVPAVETSAKGKNGNTNTADRANDGVIHVKLNVKHKNWSLQTLFNNDLTKTMILAINEAASYINFSSYDADHSGRIDKNELALGFVIAGYEAAAIEDSQGLDMNRYLWAHAASIEDFIQSFNLVLQKVPTPGGVIVSDYIAISEQMTEGEQEPISVFAHELGHYLGLPDLYDTMYTTDEPWSNYFVGDVSLMANGSWGSDPEGGYVPSSLDPWSRCRLGWYEPETAHTGEYEIAAQSYSADEAYSVLKVPTQRANEYYLLENRQFTKWDAGLGSLPSINPLGEAVAEHGGIILWHIDDSTYDFYAEDNSVNNGDHSPAVMPLFLEVMYPDNGEEGVVSLIGENVYDYAPFFDAAVMNEHAAALGGALDLPLYGKNASKNDPAARFSSGLTVSIPDESAPVMRVNVDLDHHNHVTRLIPGVPVGCKEDGVADTWYCDHCGGLFLDEAGTKPIDEAPLVKASGHAAADHNGNCTRCGEHIADPYCRYCGQTHTGTLGRFVQFFHEIAYFFAHLFGKM